MNENNKFDVVGTNIAEKATMIWNVADMLRGPFKPHEYGLIILPMTVVKRFHDCLLSTHKAVLEKYEEVKKFAVIDGFLTTASQYQFYNISKYTFDSLLADPENIEANFRDYLNGFSANVQDVLSKFDFDNIIRRMVESNTLYLVIKEFNSQKGYLGPDKISAVDCGYIFEDLVKRFSESFGEEAGAHFTSRDIIYLMTDFRRLVRKLIRWYSYITQVVRMFDEDMHKEYLFLSYLIGLLPEEKEEPVDLDGKLKLEYYKLQKTFEGAITLDKIDGQYVSSKKQGVQGNRQKSTLDEILDKINEKYKGQFSEGDRVMLGALHDKLIEDDKLASSARTSDPRIFTESIFPSAFGNAAMESYMEAQDSYGSLFEDKSKYDAVMSALAGVIYREMRSKKTVDYRKVERDEQVQMVAEEPVKYGK